MKQLFFAYRWLIVCLCLVGSSVHGTDRSPGPWQPLFKIVVAGFNNARWYKKNLDSIFSQTYKNFHILYIDDASDDGTAALVKECLIGHGCTDKCTLIANDERKFKMANVYSAIHTHCDNGDIIVELDADDWFAHDGVLELLAQIYRDRNIWLTYGQYELYPSKERGVCHQVPAHIIAANNWRGYWWATSALRTFYAGLFKRIKKEDLQHDGKFLVMTADQGFMFPMLEMAQYHTQFIPKTVYIYNRVTALNDDKVSRQKQVYWENIVRAKPRYQPLMTLPWE